MSLTHSARGSTRKFAKSGFTRIWINLLTSGRCCFNGDQNPPPPCEINQENFKTCSDIWDMLDDTNLQRNVGLASLGRAPQQRKMQNAKGIRKKFLPHHVAKYFVSLWHCMFYQSWIFRKSMIGFMIGSAISWLVGWSWLINHGGVRFPQTSFK